MFRRWKNARAEYGANPSRRAPDRAVRTAERHVHRAWTLELARWRDRQQFALHIERENCDTAIELFIAAQRDGDPEQIRVARAVAIEAVDSVRAAVAARDQARRTLRKERQLLTRMPKRLSVASDDVGHPRYRPSRPTASSNRRRGLYLRRLVRWRPANLG
jgi:hypothetical protein